MTTKVRAFVAPDNYIRVFPGARASLPELKEMGATWDNDMGAWKVPALRTYALQIIEAIGRDMLDLDESFLRIGDGWGFTRARVPLPPDAPLFDYQKDAVDYLLSNPRGSLLNLSPGLGKTAVAITAARVTHAHTILVVAPASLLLTWWREIKKWAGDPDVYTVTSYDQVVRHPDRYDQAWDLLILDESVLIKNRATLRFKAIEKVRRKVRRVWMLSGNPATRYADDLWTMMHLAAPKAFGSYWRFAERFCVFEKNIWSQTGRSITGTRASRDITWELGDVMLTIHQDDVLDLPDYLFETIDVDLTKAQWKAYTSMRDDFVWELEGGRELDADNKLAQLVRLQQITSSLANVQGGGTGSAKADALIDLLASNAYATPMIVWTHWIGGARDIMHRLTGAHINAVWVSGNDSTKARDAKLEAYKAGKHDVLVLSMGVGKYGHTLTNTRTVVYLDKTWNADDFLQSMRRVRRIGLTHRPVLVTLHAPGTVDTLVEDNLAGKMPSIAKITNAQLIELLRGVGR